MDLAQGQEFFAQQDYSRARLAFERVLEDLRNEINPIRVLHEAVALAGIAQTGRHFPLLSGLSDSAVERVRPVAQALRNATDRTGG